jgi:5'-nucleotidase
VVAPDSPQSAAGHSITLKHPLAVQPVRVQSPLPFEGVSVNGRPADCVRLAIRNLLPSPPDLVLSGINEGANIGINVFYSGTVAAAAEAAMFSIPAVAFSASTVGGVDFARAAKLCRKVLDSLLAAGPDGRTGLQRGDLINVNIPELASDNARGIRVVRQSTSGIEDLYDRIADQDGRATYRLGQAYKFIDDSEEDTDVIRLAEGFITVTPLHVDMTNRARLLSLEQIAWPNLSSE